MAFYADITMDVIAEGQKGNDLKNTPKHGELVKEPNWTYENTENEACQAAKALFEAIGFNKEWYVGIVASETFPDHLDRVRAHVEIFLAGEDSDRPSFTYMLKINFLEVEREQDGEKKLKWIPVHASLKEERHGQYPKEFPYTARTQFKYVYKPDGTYTIMLDEGEWGIVSSEDVPQGVVPLSKFRLLV